MPIVLSRIRTAGSRASLAVLAVVATVLLAAGQAYGDAHVSSRSCPVATGPTYKPPGEKPRNAYRLAVVGVPCSFAVRWMRLFAAQQIPRYPAPLAGPSGWRCSGFSYPGWRLKAYAGLCTKGALKFSWSPRFATGE